MAQGTEPSVVMRPSECLVMDRGGTVEAHRRLDWALAHSLMFFTSVNSCLQPVACFVGEKCPTEPSVS